MRSPANPPTATRRCRTRTTRSRRSHSASPTGWATTSSSLPSTRCAPWSPAAYRRAKPSPSSPSSSRNRQSRADRVLPGSARDCGSGLVGAEVDDHGQQGLRRIADIGAVVADAGTDLKLVSGGATGHSRGGVQPVDVDSTAVCCDVDVVGTVRAVDDNGVDRAVVAVLAGEVDVGLLDVGAPEVANRDRVNAAEGRQVHLLDVEHVHPDGADVSRQEGVLVAGIERKRLIDV